MSDVLRAGGWCFCLQFSGSVLQYVDAEFRRRQGTKAGGGGSGRRREAATGDGRCQQRAGDHDDGFSGDGNSISDWPGDAQRHVAIAARLSVAMDTALSAAVARRDVRRRHAAQAR